MKNINELIAGVFATGTSAVGTALQTSEVLQIISMIITILGGIVSLIVLPLLNWWKNAKKDGKIDEDEIKEGIEIVNNGVNIIKDNLDKKEGDN